MSLSGLGSYLGLFGVLFASYLLYIASNVLYNLYWHPLASFPGPLLGRASRLPWTFALLRGTLVFDSPDLHKKYGPVVRVAPNELAFLDPRVWRDVMGGGASDIPKWSGMYSVPAFLPPHLQNTTSKEHHRVLRKALAPGFSDASLRAQEPMMLEYVTALIRRLKEKCKDSTVDMEMWYRYVVFDIICDLAVGESFGCLECDDLHPWIKAMIDGGKAMKFLTAINMYPTLSTIINSLLGFGAKSTMKVHSGMAKPMIEKRIEAGDRPDLINPLIRLHGGEESKMDELITNATAIVGAGAETSAGTLTALTSLLIDYPATLEKLTNEVRSAFQSPDQITADAVSQLPYLVGCVDEALRIWPITGGPSLRLTDKDTIISGIPVPKNTVVGMWTWALYHDPTLWTDPWEYHPERFTGDPKYVDDAREAFKPFFTGSRDCIGQNLALIEMRLIIAHMVFNFDMQRTSDPASRNWTRKQKNAFIVWDKSSLPVQLTSVR
ncbi:isotrichodermin C-15 hydroxylase [Xylariales sp. AK1849]|nr:isotrichodermin C-15 hydroxylase [Xylariales sp. AK1849]